MKISMIHKVQQRFLGDRYRSLIRGRESIEREGGGGVESRYSFTKVLK